MQLAVAVVGDKDDGIRLRSIINIIREVKKEVEGIVKEVGGFGATVDKVKK